MKSFPQLKPMRSKKSIKSRIFLKFKRNSMVLLEPMKLIKFMVPMEDHMI